MPTKPTPPKRPALNATRKALLAFESQLKAYHKKLEQWDKLLQEKTRLIEEATVEMFEDEDYCCYCEKGTCIEHDYEEDEEECECGPEEAKAGCPCDPCATWRVNQKRMVTNQPDVVGDEVKFLESLFKLKDVRKDTKTSA